jgi:hypothetical protein
MERNAKKERGLPEKILKCEIGTDMIRSVKGKPNEEVELFRQIIQDERDHYERLKDNEPQDPDK